MNTFIKSMLFSSLIIISAGVNAETCNKQNKWWPWCLDQAQGPDVGSAEWQYCQSWGKCQYY